LELHRALHGISAVSSAIRQCMMELG
jgi:hypothetical protein